MLQIGKKDGKNIVTASVLSSRIPIFSPSLSFGKTNWSVETRYGKVSVSGSLTQIHRNILDATFEFALDMRMMENGAVQILFDPFIITKITASSRDYKWLKSIFSDLKLAKVTITNSVGYEYGREAEIVSEIDWSHRQVRMPSGKLKKVGELNGFRKMMVVTISSFWMKIHRESLGVSYGPLIHDISMLKSGVLQALVRHCITHRELNVNLEKILTELGALDEKTSRAKRYRVLKTVREADLSIFGINIKNDNVFYKQHKLVRFKNPESLTSCAENLTPCAVNLTSCAGSQECSRDSRVSEYIN